MITPAHGIMNLLLLGRWESVAVRVWLLSRHGGRTPRAAVWACAGLYAVFLLFAAAVWAT